MISCFILDLSTGQQFLPQGFQGLLVAEHVLAGLHDQGKPRVDGFIGLLDLLLGSHDVQV